MHDGGYVTSLDCFVAETMGGREDGKLLMGLRMRDANGTSRMRFLDRRMARKLKRSIDRFLEESMRGPQL